MRDTIFAVCKNCGKTILLCSRLSSEWLHQETPNQFSQFCRVMIAEPVEPE